MLFHAAKPHLFCHGGSSGPQDIKTQYLVMVTGGLFTAIVRFSGVTLECYSWLIEVTVKGLWQMVCGFSRNNHPLDSFLGKLLVGKIKVTIVNNLLMLVLFNMGNATQPLHCVSLGTHVLELIHLRMSHSPHIVCHLPLIQITMPGSHLRLNLGRQGRQQHFHPLQRR